MASDFPCAEMAEIWRNCLKDNDYHPDTDFAKCNAHRESYYFCLRGWRKAQGVQGPKSDVPKECVSKSDRLHTCMQLKMFDVANCQPEMQALRECSATYDKEVARWVNEPTSSSSSGSSTLSTLGSGASSAGVAGPQSWWSKLVGK